MPQDGKEVVLRQRNMHMEFLVLVMLKMNIDVEIDQTVNPAGAVEGYRVSHVLESDSPVR